MNLLAKVALIYPFYFPFVGGVERDIYEIAEALTDAGHEAFVITNQLDLNTINILAPGNIKPVKGLAEVERTNGKPTIIRIPLPHYLTNLHFVQQVLKQPLQYSAYMGIVLYRLTEKMRFDVLHPHEPAAMIATYLSRNLQLAKSKPRYVAGIHSNFYIHGSLRLQFGRLILNSFDRVIVLKVNTLTFGAAQMVAPTKSVFNPNWCDTARFTGNDKDRAKERLGLNGHEFIILSVSRLDLGKGPQLVLKAFEKLLERYPARRDTLLHIVGTGPIEDALRRYIKERNLENNVKLSAPILYNDPVYPLFFASADVFCSMQDEDGITNVVLEALSSGLPVIHSEIHGVPRDLSPLLIKMNRTDIDRVAGHMQELIEDRNLRMRLGRLNRETVKSRYDKAILLPIYMRNLLGE